MKLNTEHITRDSRFWSDVKALAKEAFPPEEYLAPSELAKMAEEDGFDFLALTDHDAFVGFMAVKIYREMAYLFFLAIAPDFRSKGYGSRAIETLRAAYPGKKQVVDFEMPDAAADNSEQREKRRAFYLKNGYRETGLFLTYLGVNYEVFCMDEGFEPELFKAMMKTIRVEGFEPKYFQQPEHSCAATQKALTMKKLGDTPEELKKAKALYYRAFPKNERRPFPELIDHRLGDTEAFCFYDADLFVGMAAVMNSPDITHIVYLAIDDDLRGHGYGSKALALLHDFYSGKRIMVDIERPDGTAENEQQRVQRKRFYLRAGYMETPVKYRWRNENYEILSFGGEVSAQDYEDFWKHFNV